MLGQADGQATTKLCLGRCATQNQLPLNRSKPSSVRRRHKRRDLTSAISECLEPEGKRPSETGGISEFAQLPGDVCRPTPMKMKLERPVCPVRAACPEIFYKPRDQSAAWIYNCAVYVYAAPCVQDMRKLWCAARHALASSPSATVPYRTATSAHVASSIFTRDSYLICYFWALCSRLCSPSPRRCHCK